MTVSRRTLLSTLTVLGLEGCLKMDDDSFDGTELDEDAVLWQYETDGRVPSSPLLYKDGLFVGSLDGNLRCVETESGSVR